jgi:hypothetical protein
MLDLKLKSTNLSSTSSTSSYVYELPDERRLFIFGRGAIESLVRFQHVAPKRSLRNLFIKSALLARRTYSFCGTGGLRL